MKSILFIIVACLFSFVSSAQFNIYNDVQTLNTLLKKNLNSNPTIEFDIKKKFAIYTNDWNRLEISLPNIHLLKYNDSTISFKSKDGNKWVTTYTKQRRFLRSSSDYTLRVKKTDDNSSLSQMIALFSSIQQAVNSGNAVYLNNDITSNEKIKITNFNYREQLDWFEKEAIKQDPEISKIRIGKIVLEGKKALYLSIEHQTGYAYLMDVTKFTTSLTLSYISINCNDEKVCVTVLKKGATKAEYDLNRSFTHLKHIGKIEEREKFYNTFVALINYARENVE